MSFVGELKILENRVINDEVFMLLLENTSDDEIKAGQFYNFKTGDNQYPLLRRPISVAYVEGNNIAFYIQKKGLGTNWLSNRKVGEYVDVIGSLGNGFDFSNTKKPLVVGGGIGIAPMIQAVKELVELGHKDVKVLLGFRNEPYGIDEFRKFTNDIEIASENADGYYKGFITDPLREALSTGEYDEVFVCGPHNMLKAVSFICKNYNVKSNLLMEEKMACGVGACLVCTCKVKDGEGDFKNLRTCKDGPVFTGDEVIFDE